MRKLLTHVMTVFCLCLFIGAADARAEVAAEQQKSGVSKVSLYGNIFTIDPSFIDRNNGDRPHSWRNIAYFIPQLMPGVRGDEDKRSFEKTLNTISTLTVRYRDLHAKSVRKLAERLEKEGHFQILEANETVDSQLRILKDVLPYAEPQERINALDGYIRVWFREGSWEEKRKKYNAFKGEEVLQPYPFMNPYKLYQYFLSMFYLDTVVRRSPEFADWAKARRQQPG